MPVEFCHFNIIDGERRAYKFKSMRFSIVYYVLRNNTLYLCTLHLQVCIYKYVQYNSWFRNLQFFDIIEQLIGKAYLNMIQKQVRRNNEAAC